MLTRATPDEFVFVGSSGQATESFALLETIPLVEGLIGSAEHCTIRLADPFVAAEHARVLRRHERWYIAAAAIATSVFVDGVAPLPGEAALLEPGALVEVGDTWFRVGGAPSRQRLPLDDDVAMLIAADEMQEVGDPLGERIATNALDVPSCLVAEVEEGLTTVELTRGLISRITTRALSDYEGALRLRARLLRLLSEPVSVGLQELEVATETYEEDPALVGRMVLHAIAASQPPHLRTLRLGVASPDGLGQLETELKQLARILPSPGGLDGLFRAPRRPEIVILEVQDWNGLEPGQRIGVVDELTLTRAIADEATEQDYPEDFASNLLFVERGQGRWQIQTRHGGIFRINGAHDGSTGRSHLRSGDEVRTAGLRFRFET
ncbi:MAG: FHA domain-containing protein [Myxococcales bacterium]|nr:FHA domain-containing protein [Myxococcales bacterium]